jgi:hypothetical protein
MSVATVSVGRKDLDGDGAGQAGVARLVDFAHSAGPEGSKDLVRAEPGTDGKRQGEPASF